MPAPPIARVLATVTLTAGLLAVVGGPTDAVSARRVPPNTTGTAAGSAANGAGKLATSLTVLPDGRVRVSWPAPPKGRHITKWRVRVGPNRTLDSKVRTYRLTRTKRKITVAPAFGVTPSSGNFTFVQVGGYRRDKKLWSLSPTKWIKAPLAAHCTASPANRVTVGTYNVRSWRLDMSASPAVRWTVRGPRAADEILASGARVVAIQEASGEANANFGDGLRQDQWLLARLNSTDTAPRHHWVDAIGDDPYRQTGGLKGTRIFYDDSLYDVHDRGLIKLADSDVPGDSLLPWARFQAKDGTQPEFLFASTHLMVGDAGSAVTTRGKQIHKVITELRALAAARPGEQVILGGDLNSTVNTKPYNNVQSQLMAAGFYDAFATTSTVNARYATTNSYRFPIKVTPLRRDYLMTLGPVKGSCGYVNRFYNSLSQVASDHFMQVATLPLSTS
jgi:endonuclease/exonuclease/phosphatase family metal-dependent hydrolase